MKAIGTYLRYLRDEQGLTRAEVALRAHTHESQIFRFESGEQEPKGLLFLKLVNAVGGNLDDVLVLALRERPTPEEGRELAERRLKTRKVDILHQQGQLQNIQDLEAFLDEVRRITAIPDVRDRAAALRALPPEVQQAFLSWAVALLQTSLQSGLASGQP